MRFRFPHFSLLLVIAMLASSPRAAEETSAGGVRPTVTADDGDTGGTFFGEVPDPKKTRRYYIAAESELWDYAPSGREELCGGSLPPPLIRNRKSGKLRYVQYTDATFTTRVIPNRTLGILGPVLRGVVGEYLAVTFVNRTDQPLSMHPHGVKYDKHSEGAFQMPPTGRGSAVAPGARFTYVWQLDEQSGPMPTEPSSKGWLYHSHVTGDAETNLGLIGAIIVTDPQRARPDGTPRDVDREFAALFMIFDESGLDQAAIEAAEYAGLPGMATETPPMPWAEMQQQLEQGSRFAINGRVFGNLTGMQMNEGERTRWYLFGLGSEQDFHTAHWHGLRVIEEGRRRTDVIELMPASMKVADLVADNPGSWLFHCHVAEHMREGMFTSITVHGRNTVGVDRAPAAAFLGHGGAANSLRIDRAESVSNASTSPSRDEVVVEGAVTVFEGFAAHNESIRVGIGQKSVELHPQSNGAANDPQARFQVKNANEFGVVLGGVMEFELVLQGAEWRREIEAASSSKPAGAGPSSPILTLTLEVARGKHVAQRALLRAGQ